MTSNEDSTIDGVKKEMCTPGHIALVKLNLAGCSPEPLLDDRFSLKAARAEARLRSDVAATFPSTLIQNN